MVRVEAPSDAEAEREGEVMQRERDLERRIAELEAENRRMREALARVHQYLCALQTVSDDLGPHVSSKSVDEHEAIARAALSQYGDRSEG